MKKSRQALKVEFPKQFTAEQANLLVDLLDSAGNLLPDPQPRSRMVVVGGQRVVGNSSDELQSTAPGGQVTTPTGSAGGSSAGGTEIPYHNSLAGLNAGDLLHITAAQLTGLTGGLDTGLHWHSEDRRRANHTGTQAIATVDGLQAELDGKAPAVHNHAIADVSGLQSELNGKALQAPIDDAKLLSGFVDNENITVSYSVTNRQITLTHPSGTIRYHFRGREKTLASPWVSPAHSNTIANWFLYSTDGTNFSWSNVAWSFEDVMISYVRKGTNLTFGLREVHGLMDPNVHRTLHANIGTYIYSGGTLTPGTFALATATDAANTPGVDTTIVSDEDIRTTIPALAEGAYRVCYPISATEFGVSNLTRPFSVGASYVQWFNGTVATEGATGKFYCVYAVAIPATADTDSQLNRWLWIAPQNQHDSLAEARSESLASINLCDLALGITEYIPRVKIIYGSSASYGSTGKVRIEAVDYLVKGTSATAVASGPSVSWNNLADIPEAIASIDNLAPAADKFPYYTGATTGALADLTPFARTLLDDLDAATMRATLGAQAAGSYQPLDADLTAIAALATTAYGRSFLTLADAAAALTLIGAQPAGSYALESTIASVAGAVDPNTLTNLQSGFTQNTAANRPGDYAFVQTLGRYNSGSMQIASDSYSSDSNSLWWRRKGDNGTWYPWKTIWHTGNLTGTRNEHNHAGVYQPLDSDLTDIAALSTQAFGRSLLTAVDAAAGRSLLGAQVAGSYEPSITAGTTAQYWRGDKSWQTLNASAVGLGNVLNVAQEPALGNPGTSGFLLSSTTAGVRSWVAPYSHPATHPQSVVDSASGWITTALAGKQPLDADLTAISALATTGFVRRTAADTWAASAMAWADISGAISYGSAAGTVCQGNDSRLSDSRTPTAHALDGALHTVSGKTAGQMLLATAATTFGFVAMSGDATLSGAGALTLASVITAGGPIGSSSVVPVITYDAKGRLTAVSSATITPAAIGAATAASLANYLPRAGGTLAGPLAGTTAAFGSAAIATTAGQTSAWFGYNGLNNGTGTPNGFNQWNDGGLVMGFPSTKSAFFHCAGALILSMSASQITAAVAISGTSASFSSRCTQAGSTIWDAGNLAFAGSGSASTMSRSDHLHSGVYQPAGSYVDLSTNQTIGGEKTFSSRVIAGGTRIGNITSFAGFSHIDLANMENYALIQGSDGETYLNASTAKAVHIRNNNAGINTWVDIAVFSGTSGQINVPLTINNNATIPAGYSLTTYKLNVGNAGATFANTVLSASTTLGSVPIAIYGLNVIENQQSGVATYIKFPAVATGGFVVFIGNIGNNPNIPTTALVQSGTLYPKNGGAGVDRQTVTGTKTYWSDGTNWFEES